MLERVIENWLDKTTERAFQQPFCYMLSAEGHTIIHSTRHSASELGKDIITIDRDGIPCAFQLKTGNITLKKWQNEVSRQIDSLVVGKIVHSSIETSQHHKSYLVTNGNIAEEVSFDIKGRNETWTNQNQSYLRLRTIDRGELFEKAKKLGTKLWPSELTDIKTLLEMFLECGKEILPKQKLASLFESTIPLKPFKNGKAPSQKRCTRSIASAGLLCAIAISSFSNQNNHVAEIEAWIMYIAYMLALAERWNLPENVYKSEFEIATQFLYDSLANLCDEIKDRTDLIEGNPLADSYVYRVRLTWLLGLMSIYALWRCKDEVPKDEIDDFLCEFCKEKRIQLKLWGEAAIPQILAFFWYFRKIDATRKPDDFLRDLISLICRYNGPQGGGLLASPYYEVEDILPYILRINEEPLTDSFKGESYALEGLVHLYTRRNWKQTMKGLWPGITRLASVSFKPENFCDFFRWRSEEGKNKYTHPKHTQNWEELKIISSESEGACIPPSIKDHPILLLLFFCVYPHRMNAEIIRWLDTQMKDIPRP
ncbi:MAG: hypothetical protein OXI43_05625 [Candidatus Poribacteria bacterium]|nr:hypothetical protein [Candidatus Poribacteria bacterium]